jgi:hypothetical protein
MARSLRPLLALAALALAHCGTRDRRDLVEMQTWSSKIEFRGQVGRASVDEYGKCEQEPPKPRVGGVAGAKKAAREGGCADPCAGLSKSVPAYAQAGADRYVKCLDDCIQNSKVLDLRCTTSTKPDPAQTDREPGAGCMPNWTGKF